MRPIPEIPAIPNPGIIKISTNINTIPVKRISISVISANPTKRWEPKNNARHSNPTIPGTPNPGDFISMKSPSMPRLINRGATIGFVRNRTNFSDQVSVISTVSVSAKFKWASLNSQSEFWNGKSEFWNNKPEFWNSKRVR